MITTDKAKSKTAPVLLYLLALIAVCLGVLFWRQNSIKNYAVSKIEAGEYKAAIETLESTTGLFIPKDALIHYAKARIYYAEGDYMKGGLEIDEISDHYSGPFAGVINKLDNLDSKSCQAKTNCEAFFVMCDYFEKNRTGYYENEWQ